MLVQVTHPCPSNQNAKPGQHLPGTKLAYLAIKQELAEPDPLRLAWRDLIKQTIRAVVTQADTDALSVIKHIIEAQGQIVLCLLAAKVRSAGLLSCIHGKGSAGVGHGRDVLGGVWFVVGWWGAKAGI